MQNKVGKFLVATGAIIENSSTGKILLLKRSGTKDYSPGIWEYTTGRLHQFEEPEDGLRREIREETGLEVEIVKPISIFHIFRGEKVAENELVGIMFWCKTDTEEVKVSEEHSGHMWIEAEEALKLLDKPGMKGDIEAFMRERKKFRKINTIKVLKRDQHHWGRIPFVENIGIDNTNLSPKKVVKLILKELG